MSDGRGGGATPGALHIVSTPIGNLADLSPRAVAVLREVQLVLAEDSRVARVLLSSIEINTETTSLPGFDEADRIAPIIARLLAGDAVALISDAGTPLISDPGQQLVRAAIAAGIRIVPIPGASALLAAVVASGVAGARWNFGRWNNLAGCVESSEGEDSSNDQRCIAPKPTPELIPSEAELISQTISTFQMFGIKVSKDQIDVYRDDWGAYATVSNSFNDQPLPIDFYISWGMDGKIAYVSAASFEIIERGEFGTVSPTDAVARIKDGRWYGGVSSKYYKQYTRPITTMTKDASAGATTEGSVGTEDQPVETSEPIGEGPTEPQIVDLRINRSEAVLVSVYDKGGNMWLVPGYLLFNDQGWFDSIISLVEGVIELPEPYVVMPIEETDK